MIFLEPRKSKSISDNINFVFLGNLIELCILILTIGYPEKNIGVVENPTTRLYVDLCMKDVRG